jgi:signal transduction histidine kinase
MAAATREGEPRGADARASALALALAALSPAACAAPAAPGALALPWLLGAASLGALIALAAVVVAQRLRNVREIAAMRRTLTASADAWWRTDTTLTIVEANAGRASNGPLDAQRLVGRKPWEVAPGPAPAPLLQAVGSHAPFFDVVIELPADSSAAGATTGSSPGGAVPPGQARPGADPARRIVALSGAPMFSATGKFAGYAGVIRDLTAPLAAVRGPDAAQAGRIRELEAESAERTHQFELAARELDSFAHSVSHDLRAPLRVVDGFATIVLEDYGATGRPLDDLGREHLRRIVTAGARMNSMIDTLLAMSKMTSREIERERVNLSQLARELAEELRAQDAGRKVDFVLAEGLAADGDRTLLRLVLQNLLGNAWKFTAKAEPAARIEFGARQDNGNTIYSVSDNGAGFDMRFADKLFGLFQRFHSQNEFPGTGVGLATVQRIVRKHGGRIWAESAPGKGATFLFTLWEKR